MGRDTKVLTAKSRAFIGWGDNAYTFHHTNYWEDASSRPPVSAPMEPTPQKSGRMFQRSICYSNTIQTSRYESRSNSRYILNLIRLDPFSGSMQWIFWSLCLSRSRPKVAVCSRSVYSIKSTETISDSNARQN